MTQEERWNSRYEEVKRFIETNLVGMRHEHDLGAVFTFAMGDAVAIGVGRDVVDIRTDCFGEEGCDALLAA